MLEPHHQYLKKVQDHNIYNNSHITTSHLDSYLRFYFDDYPISYTLHKSDILRKFWNMREFLSWMSENLSLVVAAEIGYETYCFHMGSPDYSKFSDWYYRSEKHYEFILNNITY